MNSPGVTTADLLLASMAAKLFHPHSYANALVELESIIKHAAASEHVTKQTLYWLSYTSPASYIPLDTLNKNHNLVLFKNSFSINVLLHFLLGTYQLEYLNKTKLTLSLSSRANKFKSC